MSDAQARQERIAAAIMSVAAVGIAGMTWLDRPEPGASVEQVPDWYATFTLVLHGAILALLLVAPGRLSRMTTDRPSLRTAFMVMILAAILAAAYVVAVEIGLV